MSSDFNFDNDIAVVGMAGRFAGARNLVEFWANLRGGVEALTRFTEDELLAAGADPADLADPNYVPVGAVMPDMEGFDAKFFGFSPREASIMDPQHRHFLEVSWQALEDAGHVPEHFAGSIGVFGGSGHNAYMPYNLLTNPALMKQVGFFLVRHTGNDKDFLTTRVSYLLNLKGPSVNVQTACSTSLVAIHLGVQSLLNRECDMALAGGVTIELPHRHGYVYRESEILSPDGHCHAFDAGSQGTVFGSGVGVVVLRRLQDAIDDGDHIHAVIKGSAVNNDGALKVGYMAPSVDGQAHAIAEALAIADVSADTITYVEAHGTGTPVGDPIEVAALTQAFRQSTDKTQYCGIGSVKSNIGHTDTAAGVANFIKAALALRHKELPPTLFFEKNNPACDFESSPFYVNHTLKAWTPPAGVPRRAGVSSLGVGGTNAHVIVQEAPVGAPSGPSRKHQLLVQSAKSVASLDGGSKALAQHLAAEATTNLADVAHTLRVGRQAMKQRRIVVARNAVDAAKALDAKDAARVFTDVASEDARNVAFMFAGGGAQHPNMGLDLYREEPVFRAVVDEGLAICERKLNRPLREVVFAPAGQEEAAARKLEQPSLALPALLTMQVAMARLMMSWGIEPAAMIGHSMGEYTAAHLAGVFTFEDALTIVELRGRLFETLPEGAMLGVPLSESELAPLMTPQLSVSVINAPKMTVVGGPVAAIEALQAKLAAQEVDAARVRINVAAHSAMLEPILEPFAAFFQRIAMKPPALPFVSNLSGTWITAAEATDPAYWVRHLRNTVRFADGVQVLLDDPSRVLLEVGPGRTLSSLARQHPARKASHVVVNSMRHPDEAVDDQAQALTVLGRLWACGVAVAWDKLQGQEKRLRVSLPGYAFDHQRHWVEPGRGTRELAPHERSLHKRKDVAQWFYQPSWELRPLANVEPRKEATRTLVFADAAGVAQDLAAVLRARGDDVAIVHAAKGYQRSDADTFGIDPASRADMLELVATLSNEERVPSRIVHAFSVTGDDAAAPLATLRRMGFDSLLMLAQALGEEDWDQPIDLLVLSDRMQRVAGEAVLHPAKALLLGPASVIPREFTNLRCTSLDIDTPRAGTRPRAQLVQAIVNELDAGLADGVLALRGGQRWMRTHAAMPIARPVVDQAAPTLRPARLRERGVYLVTGGLGGVGLALAEHLASTLKARLVLVGRTPMPAREQWGAVLADPATPLATARRLRQLIALEHKGAEVMVAAADVSDAAKMEAVIRDARRRFGDLHGVLHTAGVLDDGVIQLKELQAASRVFAPKVEGTLALDAALSRAQQAPLDFIVLFSSISAFAGLAGQVDYAAANAFLDAYAQERSARDGTWTVAVNWSQWQEVGMAAELAHQLGLDAQPSSSEPVATIGHAFVDRCLLDTPQERLYETRFSRATHWLLEEHRVRDGDALIPGTGYLEIVRTAFAQRAQPGEGEAIELADVTFLSPFAVKPGGARDLRVHLLANVGTGDGHAGAAASCAFAITGRDSDADASQAWTEHVRGTIGIVKASASAPGSSSPRAARAADIRARCTARHQQGAKPPVHLHFGPRWSNIVGIDFGTREALVELALPEAYRADLRDFPLHPALLDLATGGAQTLLPGYDESRDFFVPASYDTLRIHAPLAERVFSHVRLRDDEALGTDLAGYDVTISDGEGRVLVEIEGFTMIRVRDKALLAAGTHAAAAAAASTTQAKPRATANNILSVGLREGILTREGADVLERVLGWGQGAQVIVSPQDLEALLAQMRGPVSAPAQTHDADAAATPGARLPITPTEKLIAQMWGEMLGHARVAASDNFFDLGGHSLLAVQVINKLKKRTGKPLALTALIEAPTVEELAALIAPEEAAQMQAQTPSAGDEPAAPRKPAAAPIGVPKPGVVGRTIVPIKKGEGRPPLFLVHDGLGETLLYRTLAYKLDPAHAVYGLQPAMRADGSFVHTRIVDMAAAHVEQLRSVQPEGPYYLAGLCAGGVIAQEMALQLQGHGERISYLGILDAADVAATDSDYEGRNRRARFMATLGDSNQPLVLRLVKAVPKMAAKVAGFVRYKVAHALEQRRTAQGVDALRSGHKAAIAESTQEAFLKMYELAHREHHPQGRLRAEHAVLYRATQGTGAADDVPFAEKYVEADMGWGPRFEQSIDVHDVPGGHTSLLQEPNVQTLAGLMQKDVDAAMAQSTPRSPSDDKAPATQAELAAAAGAAKADRMEVTP